MFLRVYWNQPVCLSVCLSVQILDSGKVLAGVLTLSQTSPGLKYRSFESTVGKGEIAPFPAVFSTQLENSLSF